MTDSDGESDGKRVRTTMIISLLVTCGKNDENQNKSDEKLNTETLKSQATGDKRDEMEIYRIFSMLLLLLLLLLLLFFLSDYASLWEDVSVHINKFYHYQILY